MKQKYFLKIFMAIFVLVFTASLNSRAEDKDDSVQEMEIKAIGFDQRLQSPIVLLTDKEQASLLPIWIGLCEARSIELSLSSVVPPRPLTYDLIAAMVRTMGANIDRIVVVDLRDEVFYAQVEMSVDGKVFKIDARPSDAIALASRMGSPIYVKKTVLEKAALPGTAQEKRGL